MNISGTVTDSNKAQSWFDIRPTQYTPLLHATSDFPTIHDSPRWTTKKPIPAPGCTISVGGFLHRVKHTGRDNAIESFLINFANIAYITERKQPRDTTVTTTQSGSSSSRTRFDYQAKKNPPKHLLNTENDPRDPDTKPPSPKKLHTNSEENIGKDRKGKAKQKSPTPTN